MHLNLVLAVFWLLLGMLLIFQPLLKPELPQWTILGSSVSIGWAAIVLAVYNLARWGLVVNARRRRARETAAARQQVLRKPPHPPREPDPNFDFTESPSHLENEGRPP